MTSTKKLLGECKIGVKWFLWLSLGALLAVFSVLIGASVNLQWFWLLAIAAAVIAFTSITRDPITFFRGGLEDSVRSTTQLIQLSCSIFATSVFATSIYISSNLGASYGIVGGLSFAAYSTGFISAGGVIYQLRRKGYKSLPEAINARYGPLATMAFGLAVMYRIIQEVWANVFVVAAFYGETHSRDWWLASVLCALIPACYCATGGMRASLTSGVTLTMLKWALLTALLVVLGINKPENSSWTGFNSAGTCDLSTVPASPRQAINRNALACSLAGGLRFLNETAAERTKVSSTFIPSSCSFPRISNGTLCVSLGGVFKPSSCSLETEPVCTHQGGSWSAREMWSLQGGCDLLIVALLQGMLSFPFSDAALTDRGFLAHPKTMLLAFLIGGSLAATFVLVSSFIGIFGSMEAILNPAGLRSGLFEGMKTGQPTSVAQFFGTAVYSVATLLLISSSVGVLNACFCASGKLLGPELLGFLKAGRPRTPNTARRRHMFVARLVIPVVLICGLLPLLGTSTPLDATIVSGTLAMGLGPPIFALVFINGYRPLTFHLPFWCGLALGIVYQLSKSSCCSASLNVSALNMGSGPFASLLGFNVVGVAACWGLMFVTLLENPGGWHLQGTAAGATTTLGHVREKLMLPFVDPSCISQDELQIAKNINEALFGPPTTHPAGPNTVEIEIEE